MPRCLAGNADHVDVVVHRVLRGLVGGLEQRAHVHVEADVGEGGGDHLGAAVVAVLAHLDDQHTGSAALCLGKGLHVALDPGETFVAVIGRAVDAGERADLGAVAAEHVLHRHADLSHGRARPRGFDRGFQKVPALARAARDLGQRRVAGGLVAGGADGFQAGDLARADLHVVDVEDVDRVLAVLAVLVDADDHLFAAVDHGLSAGGRLLDPELGLPGGDGLGHAAHRLDLLDDRPGLFGQFGR